MILYRYSATATPAVIATATASPTATVTPAVIREFKITTTATATGTPLNKKFNEQNNGSARALLLFVHFFAVLCKTTT